MDKLIPYNIYPNLETELADKLLTESPNLTKAQFRAELPRQFGPFWTGIMELGLSKIDWEWLRVKHNMAS